MTYGEQFEYKVVDIYGDLEKELNKLGFQGWELICISPCILKRKK